MIVAMVALVAADNSVDTLKKSMSRQENVEAEEVCDEDGDESDEEENEDEYQGTAEEDLELFHFFDCIGCKAIFCEKGELVRHVRTCDNR